MSNELGSYDGRKIVRSKLKITKAGDGLSQALAIDPQMLHWGDKVYVVLECDTGPVTHRPIKDSDSDCEIVFSLVAGTGTIVDAALVKSAVEAQTAKIIEAREHELGIQQLPTDDKLRKDHDAGKHAKSPYIGCPVCFKVEASSASPAKKPAGTTTGASKPSNTTPKKSAAKSPAKKSAAKK